MQYLVICRYIMGSCGSVKKECMCLLTGVRLDLAVVTINLNAELYLLYHECLMHRLSNLRGAIGTIHYE
jgi:hypothetical protein